MKKLKQIIILFVIAGCLGAFFYFDLGQYQSLEYIKEQQANFAEFYKENLDLINRVSKKYSVDPFIIVTIAGVESNYGVHHSQFSVFISL